jgi:translation initiation factor 4E
VSNMDPSEYVIKHPLQNTWTMWYDGPGPAKKMPTNGGWQSNVKRIVSFSTLEDFWCLYNNLVVSSKLSDRSTYHLFKKDIVPAWEDPANADGGRWVIEFKKSESTEMNKAWLLVLLGLIGEQFEDSDEICGVVIGLRKAKNRLALWTRTAKKVEVQKSIGRAFRTMLEATRTPHCTYSMHHDLCRASTTKRGACTTSRSAEAYKGSGRCGLGVRFS